MLQQLTEQVWYGNWEAPFECFPGAIINVAHNFSARRGRDAYWQRLASLDYRCLYFRLARKDREDVDDRYMQLLTAAVDAVRAAQAFPLVCHCQLGGHRGPSSALFAAWHLGGRPRRVFEELRSRLIELTPGILRGRNYWQSLQTWCLENCLDS